MSKDVGFSIFAEEEDEFFAKWRKWRDGLFKPIVQLLARYGVTAWHLSFVGLIMVVPFIFFFKFNPWLAFFFLLLNVFFDGIDGPLARIKGSVSVSGELTDLACDQLSFLIVFMTFLYYQLVGSFWGALYIVNYFLMLAMVIYCRLNKIRFFPVLRTKYVIYLVFLLWILTGVNFFDTVIVFFTVYMVLTNYFLFQKIRCSLQ